MKYLIVLILLFTHSIFFGFEDGPYESKGEIHFNNLNILTWPNGKIFAGELPLSPKGFLTFKIVCSTDDNGKTYKGSG